MRTVLVMMVVCLLSLAGCSSMEGNRSVSVYGNPEEDGVIGLRAGVEVVENLEVGASTLFDPYNDSDDQTYGAYSLLHFPGETISPYIGGQVNIGEGCWQFNETIQPIVGISRGPVFIEWQAKDLNGNEDVIFAGVKYRF